MGNLTRYFSAEEEEWIKKQPEGYLRDLVQIQMHPVEYETDLGKYKVKPGGVVPYKNEKSIKRVSEKKIENHKSNAPKREEAKSKLPTGKGDGLNTCKSCGSLLPYYKGKCKNC